jgi:long-chain acyl-CoA synthetase
MMPNCLQYPIAMFGMLRAGYTVVNVNPLYTARELEHQLCDAGCEAIVIVENFAHTLQEVASQVTSLRHGGDRARRHAGLPEVAAGELRRPPRQEDGAALEPAPGGDVSRGAAPGRGPSAEAGPDHPRRPRLPAIHGGTTGVAKGAMLTHGNIIANLQQAHAWISPYVKEGEELIVTALPLYHIFR